MRKATNETLLKVWAILLALTIVFCAPYLMNMVAPSVNVPAVLASPPVWTLLFIAMLLFLALSAYMAKGLQRALVALLAFALFWPVTVLWSAVLLPFSLNPPFVEVYKSCEDLERLYHLGVGDELDGLLTKGRADCLHDKNPGLSIGKSGESCWRAIGIKHMGSFVTDTAQIPTLHGILSDPNIVNAFLSILDPGVHIPPHRGYGKSFMRYHLGHRIPEGAYIVVGGQEYRWQEGRGVQFDDMYEHYVVNSGTETRVVLYLDVLRSLPEPLHTLNSWVVHLMGFHPLVAAINKSDHKQKSI
jgi:beta-hydroxylase